MVTATWPRLPGLDLSIPVAETGQVRLAAEDMVVQGVDGGLFGGGLDIDDTICCLDVLDVNQGHGVERGDGKGDVTGVLLDL
jgi:hypothetical protein